MMTWLSHLRQSLLKNPLFALAVAAVTGTVIADHWDLQPAWILGILVLGSCLLFWRKPSLARAFPAVLFILAYLHAVRLADTFDHPLRQHLLTLPDHPSPATLQGYLYPWTEGAELDQATALCEVTHMRWGSIGPFLPMKAWIKVQLPEGTLLKEAGHYEINGVLSLPRPPTNPGQFDSVNYSLRMGWVAFLRAQDMILMEKDPVALRFHLLHAAESSRQWITEQLSKGLENEGDHAGVILAMALGTSDAAGDDIEDAFRDSGTLHVFAVSGLHVVMLGGMAFWLLRGFGVRRVTLFVIVLVFAYAFITGWRPSAARAAFMSSMMFLAPLLHRQSRLINALGASALILLVLDSHQLFTPGFQLSFGVLLAIAWIASLLMNRTTPWTHLDPFLPSILATRWQRLGVWSRTWVASLICVSLAAWAGSLPLTLGHFQTLTPVAVVANLLLVPASGICLILACASLVMAACQQTWAVIYINHGNAYLAKVMVMLASWFAELPMANHTVDLRFQGEPAAAELRIFHLTGGGGSAYLRAGDTRWLLDTGNTRSWRHVVRPFLRYEGINSLDGLILSHADVAHVGATPLVLKAQHVPRFHTSRLEPWPYDPPFASLKKLDDLVRPDGAVWRRSGIDDVLKLSPDQSLPATAEVLHPGATDLHEKADDRGLVLMLHIGGFRILCLNDAGFITEKRLLERHAAVQCDILVRYQHRVDVSGLTELLLAAQPQAVISSNDSFRLEEALPHRVREHCAAHHIPLFDLEATGSVGMEFREGRVELRSFISPQPLVLQPKPKNP